MMKRLLVGITLLPAAWRLILTHPKLAILSALPMVLTLGLIVYLKEPLQGLILVWISPLLTQVGLATTGSSFVTSVLTMLVTFLAFSPLVSLLTIPFMDYLAESAESYTPLTPAPSPSLKTRTQWILQDILKSVISTTGMILCFFIGWFPPFVPFSLVGMSLLFSYQMLSYPSTRRGGTWSSDLREIFRQFPSALTFGMCAGFLVSLPFVGVLTLPGSVVAGTLLYAFHRNLKP